MPVIAYSATQPPKMPVKFMTVVSSGSAMMHAMTRVTTRYRNESTAVASSASTCSVTFMAATSAPMPGADASRRAAGRP